jgi:large subunit ribosomal protein L13
VYKSYYPKAAEIKNDWVVVDAAGQTLGRVAAKVAALLIGKHKPTFTPGVPGGDNVVVINASYIVVTGKKMEEKMYNHHSGYPGGLKTVALRDQLKTYPDRVIRAAVWGMLPHNKMGRQIIKRLRVYGGAEHPHGAQVAE